MVLKILILRFDKIHMGELECYRPEVFLDISTKFIGKHLCQSLFFNKVAGLRPATLLKERLWHRCFPVNFAKFLIKLFLQNTSGRLLPSDACIGTSFELMNFSL